MNGRGDDGVESGPVSGQGAELRGMSDIELARIKLIESNNFAGGKFFEMPAPSAPSAPVKAERWSV